MITRASNYELAEMLMEARGMLQEAVHMVQQYVEDSGDKQAEETILAHLAAIIAPNPEPSSRDVNINVWIERAQYGDDFYPDDEELYDEDADDE